MVFILVVKIVVHQLGQTEHCHIPNLEQGTILVLGTAHDLPLIERTMPQIDRAIVQVLIKSVIVEVNLGNTTDLGIDILRREFMRNGVTGAGASTPTGSFRFTGKPPKNITDPGKLSGLSLSRGLDYWLTFRRETSTGNRSSRDGNGARTQACWATCLYSAWPSNKASGARTAAS
jgi:hypothetical protein